MNLPSIDDRAIWDVWLSQYQLPVVLAADDLGIFRFLRGQPASVDELCSQLGLLRRSAAALAGALAAMGFLVQHRGRFQLTQLARTSATCARSRRWWTTASVAAGSAAKCPRTTRGAATSGCTATRFQPRSDLPGLLISVLYTVCLTSLAGLAAMRLPSPCAIHASGARSRTCHPLPRTRGRISNARVVRVGLTHTASTCSRTPGQAATTRYCTLNL